MKTNIKKVCLALVIILATTFSANILAQANEKHVFILSGQSNMARFKPEPTFIPLLNETFGEAQVLVVKDAKGGQPIREWYKDWQPEEGKYTEQKGKLYDRLMEKVKPALEGIAVKSVTFIWMQGERDAKEGHGSVYEKSLIGLYNQLKQDLNQPEINFIIGRLSDFGVSSTKNPDWNMIRDIQVKVAATLPKATWVDCDDLNDGESKGGKIINNGLHYSIEGYKTLGIRYAEAAIKLINKDKSLSSVNYLNIKAATGIKKYTIHNILGQLLDKEDFPKSNKVTIETLKKRDLYFNSSIQSWSTKNHTVCKK